MTDGLTRRLTLSVALVAAAMLMVEILVTRLFSVLFFYHYSFFAVSLVMSGLSLGGILASRLQEGDPSSVQARLCASAIASSAGIFGALALIVTVAPSDRSASPSLGSVLALSLSFVPSLTAAGTFLALAFRYGEASIGRLYAADLTAAGLACLASIPLMRALQGPAALLLPALLAALAAIPLCGGSARLRAASAVLMLCSALGAAAHLATGGIFLRLPLAHEPSFERWNEHSRILAYARSEDPHSGLAFIDKSAGTFLPFTGQRRSGDPLPVEPWWGEGVTSLAYRTGRPLARAAIIGVGGGRDVLTALAHGTGHVDGYELNGILLDLLGDVPSSLAHWPEVSLVHSEARVAIAHSDARYDVIQASLIDTWAATASGGFVLSENGLYTVQAWRTFLRSLSGTGILTMTRWYLPEAPAEVERLVSLAAASLTAEGVADTRSHLLLVAEKVPDAGRGIHQTRCTLLASRSPFFAEELVALREVCRVSGWQLLLEPDVAPGDPTLSQLCAGDRTVRDAAIRKSPFDLSPPTDLRPYFFLQMRPSDILMPVGHGPDFIVDITFRAVKVLGLLCVVSLAFALAVAGVGLFGSRHCTGARSSRAMLLYFAGIGFGYILVQLGLHQRLTLILGHPTLSLSVVLFSMLWSTGLGSAASQRLRAESFPRAWAAIVALLGILVVAVPGIGTLDRVSSPLLRAAACALVAGITGFALGYGFPLGIRLLGTAGSDAIPTMWAVNGAASIAGSALAAIIGLALGSRAVLAAGLVCYVGVAACGWMVQTRAANAPP